jgi:hypothetical protein
MFGQRGMTNLGRAIEAYFAPASKLRTRASVTRTCFVRRRWELPPRIRDEREFTAVGTWAAGRVRVK